MTDVLSCCGIVNTGKCIGVHEGLALHILWSRTIARGRSIKEAPNCALLRGKKSSHAWFTRAARRQYFLFKTLTLWKRTAQRTRLAPSDKNRQAQCTEKLSNAGLSVNQKRTQRKVLFATPRSGLFLEFMSHTFRPVYIDATHPQMLVKHWGTIGSRRVNSKKQMFTCFFTALLCTVSCASEPYLHACAHAALLQKHFPHQERLPDTWVKTYSPRNPVSLTTRQQNRRAHGQLIKVFMGKWKL